MYQLFIGQIVHTKSLNELEAIVCGFVAVDAYGKIAGIGTDLDLWRSQNPDLLIAKEVHLTVDQFLMPGFVDCHIHAPQMAQIGLGLDMPLLEWLNTYTFPLEAKFTDQKFAAQMYKKVVETTIRCGTTLASYFGTNDKNSTIILAKEALAQGQRALVGKVCSNCNCPEYYVESTEESLVATKKFIEEMKALETDLVRPTITPRFALSCTEELMSQLADIAREYNLNIQSHISENVEEIKFVNKLFGSSYASAYDKVGLLTNKTIMAHAVHLEDDEIILLKERGTAVAHCPSSNNMLCSGLCDVQRLIRGGIKVGLGTDVSGGNSASIQDAILRTLDVSHALEFINKQDIKGSGTISLPDKHYTPLSYKQALFLATLGGAEALAMDDCTGNFMIGKDFDALLIDTSVYPLRNCNSTEVTENRTESKLLELVQKFIYVGDDRNIQCVFVAGKQLKKH